MQNYVQRYVSLFSGKTDIIWRRDLLVLSQRESLAEPTPSRNPLKQKITDGIGLQLFNRISLP